MIQRITSMVESSIDLAVSKSNCEVERFNFLG